MTKLYASWKSGALPSGSAVLRSPTIRTAIAACMSWLDVHCPGCGTSHAIDIRTIDRHPLATGGSLVIGLRCSMCHGTALMPVLRGLYADLRAAHTSTIA